MTKEDPINLNLDQWFSLSEAADYLEVTTQRVLQLVWDGRIARRETSVGFFYSKADCVAHRQAHEPAKEKE